MVFSNILLVALTLFSTSIANPSLTGRQDGSTYSGLQQFVDDLPPCINNCWGHVWNYAAAACPSTDNIKCVCLIPEPDLTDPILGQEFGGTYTCAAACSSADQAQYDQAEAKLNQTCQPYYDQYGVPASQSATYYESVLSTATATVTYQWNTTYTPAPTAITATSNSTVTTSPAGNLTVASATVTASVVVATTNAAALNNINWEMSVGLPMFVSFVVGLGAHFF